MIISTIDELHICNMLKISSQLSEVVSKTSKERMQIAVNILKNWCKQERLLDNYQKSTDYHVHKKYNAEMFTTAIAERKEASIRQRGEIDQRLRS